MMKSTSIQMDKTGTMWNLWIGFHAKFGVGLAFIGSIILFLAVKQFSFLREQHF